MARRRKPTAAQKAAAAERRERFRKMVATVSAMSEVERQQIVDRLGAVPTCEGRPLGAFNSVLILNQIEAASMVGGFRQWKAAGRCVRKGEHALAIWVPSRRKGEPGEVDDEQVRFFLGNVFDISQTDELQEGA